MKKLIFILLALVLYADVYAQQSIPNEFFGLKYGNKYSLEQVKTHVGDKGNYVETDESVEFGSMKWTGHSFSDADFSGRHYPSMVIMMLTSDVFGGLMLVYSDAILPEGQTIDSVYSELLNELSGQYTFVDMPLDESGTTVKASIDDNGNAIILSRNKSEDDEIVSITYLSFSLIYSDFNSTALPTIQDTFFGMKMGSIQSVSTLKSALGYKGEYLDEQYDSFGKNVSFTKLIFAGKTWDYGNFKLSDKGELYWISAYDSLNDGYSYEDEKKEAERTYEAYKEKLNDKYGQREEKTTDDSRYVIYLGENDMAIILTNERSKSQGGSYRRYVKIEYIQTAINQRRSDSNQDEL